MKRKNAALVPTEIQTEILLRLPVKSLLRFKRVEKSWRNIIEDPTFVTMHTSLFGKTTNGFLLCDFAPTPYYCYDNRRSSTWNPRLTGSKEILVSSSKWLVIRETPGYLIGSSEGLVCFSDRHDGFTIHIWNPSTRKIMKLPSFVCEEVILELLSVFGFGFCPKLKDYKVVLISEPFQNLVKVYSLNTNSWKKIAMENRRMDILLDLKRGKFFNGAFHWPGKKLNSSRTTIVAFKIEEEVLVEINLPNDNSFRDERLYLYIAEYQNLLSLITNRYDEDVAEAWVRKEDGVADQYAWVKQFRIEIPIQKYDLGFLQQSMMNFEKNGELLLVLNRDGRLVWYNTKTKQIEKVHELGDELGDEFWHVISCKQSLISLPREISEF